MRKSVVVTGASTGIGRAAVAELVKAGFHVWPTVRRAEDAQALADEFHDAVEPLLLDVTDEDAVRVAGEQVAAAGPLHGLVNNAGAVLPGSLRAELAPSGIRVILIEPGAIKTPIWGRGIAAGEEVLAGIPPEGLARYEKQFETARELAKRGSANGLPPEQAGRAIARAFTAPNPRSRQLVGRDAKVAAFLVRVLPNGLIDRLTAARR